MERYEIWQARVKFEDSEQVKERPVMVWNECVYIMAYKLTGTNRGDDRDEYQIRFLEKAGLKKPTFIRLRKILKLEPKDFFIQNR